MSSLTVEGLTKAFSSTPVLTGVDLHVPSGSLTALLGPSGCGKTTLLRLVAGFDDPDSGTVAVGDRLMAGGPGRSVAARRRGIGFVPQEGGLFPHLTARDNVTLLSRFLGKNPRWIDARAAELAQMARLPASRGDGLFIAPSATRIMA